MLLASLLLLLLPVAGADKTTGYRHWHCHCTGRLATAGVADKRASELLLRARTGELSSNMTTSHYGGGCVSSERCLQHSQPETRTTVAGCGRGRTPEASACGSCSER